MSVESIQDLAWSAWIDYLLRFCIGAASNLKFEDVWLICSDLVQFSLVIHGLTYTNLISLNSQ